MNIKEELSLLDKEKEEFMKSYWTRRQNIENQCTHENPEWDYNYQQQKDYGYELYFSHSCPECGYYYEIIEGDEDYLNLLEKYHNGELD